MLSVANVRSAGGAANYFAKDNYYTKADADRSGEWFGKGADYLGLKGEVEAESFEAILRGELASGIQLGSEGRGHRAGTDLTFSLPKSWSLLALVGGDKRIIDAYRSAVKETLGWAEKNAAETRIMTARKEKIVATGNLAVALFQHDTNRNQEPNVHFHAVVANATRAPDGKWRALRNDKLWSMNTLLNSVAMARFRAEVEKLGYIPARQGKHGNFEVAGISREAVMAFSTRRQEVLDARRGPGLEAGRIAVLATRAPKKEIEDRDALVQDWRKAAHDMGLDLASVIDRAKAQQLQMVKNDKPAASLVERGKQWLRAFAEKLNAPAADPLVPKHILSKGSEEIAAAQAAASAVRHLGQREAAFSVNDLLKTALDFGLPTTIAPIERRVRALLRNGDLTRGRGISKDFVTTRDALELEGRILEGVERGRGQGSPFLAPEAAAKQLQGAAQKKYAMTLNQGQELAGTLMLSSSDRIIAVQGIAGAGKSSLLKPAAALLREQGKTVLGLAVQNTLVQMLERDTGISSMTLAKFLGSHKALLEEKPDAKALASAKSAMKDHVLVLDEASMVSNSDKEKLVRLSNLLGVDRLVMIGDKKQLGAVDAGKPFALMQAAGIETAKMITNLRARDKTLRRAQYAAQGGDISGAMDYLKDNIVEVAENSAVVAAEQWLGLASEERKTTSIYASGRKLRSEVNEAVQTGLKANGELGKKAFTAETLSRVNLTREELRYSAAYRPGMVLEMAQVERSQKLHKGQYSVKSVDEARKEIWLTDWKGRKHRLRPTRLRSHGDDSKIALYEKKDLTIYAGDRIRWTDSDHRRGLYNAAQAEILDITKKHVAVRTPEGTEFKLGHKDPMLKHIDLAYALNAHMAQGLTSDRGIAVMNSRERNLSNKQTFLVTITRLRDQLTLIVDNRDKLEAAVGRNDGAKTSALEVTDRLGKAAAKGLSKGLAKGQENTRDRERDNQPDLAKEAIKSMEISM